MARSWYVAPYRVQPGDPVPGTWAGDYWSGPHPQDMVKFRGPAPTCAEVVVLAVAWRNEGKRSDLWLTLVEDGHCTHTMKFDPEHVQTVSGA